MTAVNNLEDASMTDDAFVEEFRRAQQNLTEQFRQYQEFHAQVAELDRVQDTDPEARRKLQRILETLENGGEDKLRAAAEKFEALLRALSLTLTNSDEADENNATDAGQSDSAAQSPRKTVKKRIFV